MSELAHASPYAESAIHPAALNEADIDRMKRYGVTESRAIVDLLGAIKREAYDAGRADVLENGDGYHTFDELYYARMLYHAILVKAWNMETWAHGEDPDNDPWTVKSWRHSDGEQCFGGGWFIVVTRLPTGQISQHYKAEHWDLFKVPAVETPPEFDGHTAIDVLDRLRALITGGSGR